MNWNYVTFNLKLFYFRVSTFECVGALLSQETFSVPINDFQDFEFCPQAEFSTSVCDGDRVLQSLNHVSKWRPAAFIDFVQNKFWLQNFVPP